MISSNLPEWVKKEAEEYDNQRAEDSFLSGAQAVLERVAPLIKAVEWIPFLDEDPALVRVREALAKWRTDAN